MILVYVESKDGQLIDASLSALGAAATLGNPVCALTVGATDHETLKSYGVEKAFSLEDARFGNYAPTALSKAIHQVIMAQAPGVVVAGSTHEANEVLARAAALGDWGFAPACTKLTTAGDAIDLTRITWGGSLFQEAQLVGSCKLLSVDPISFPPQLAATPGLATVEAFPVSLEDADFVDQLKSVEKGEREGISLTEAKVVIGGGRGMGNEAAFAMLEELAELLNGAVGGSRVATNNGWRPHSDQIGQTGTQIAPDVYLACGISGAIQHMVGCKSSKNIIAINKDSDAPIFQRANYGVLGDLHDIVPALIEEIKKVKSG